MRVISCSPTRSVLVSIISSCSCVVAAESGAFSFERSVAEHQSTNCAL